MGKHCRDHMKISHVPPSEPQDLFQPLGLSRAPVPSSVTEQDTRTDHSLLGSFTSEESGKMNCKFFELKKEQDIHCGDGQTLRSCQRKTLLAGDVPMRTRWRCSSSRALSLGKAGVTSPLWVFAVPDYSLSQSYHAALFSNHVAVCPTQGTDKKDPKTGRPESWLSKLREFTRSARASSAGGKE